MRTTLMQFISRALLLPLWVVAVGILVKGYSDVGDGFSAGVLASLAVAIRWIVTRDASGKPLQTIRWAKAALAGGLLLALIAGFGPMLIGAAPMTHYPAPDQHVTKFGSLEVHTILLFDLGIFFLVLGASVAALQAAGHFQGKAPS